MKYKLLISILLFLTLFGSAAPVPNASSAGLGKVIEKYWAYQVEKDLYARMTIGLPIEKLPDVSEEEIKADGAFHQSILDDLKQIQTDGLNEEEMVSYQMLQWTAENSVQFPQYYKFDSLVTPYASPIPLTLRVFSEFSFQRKEDQQRYLQLLSQYPGFLGKIRDHIQKQKESGILISRQELPLVTGFLKSLSQTKEKSPFYVGDIRLTSVFPTHVVDEFQKEVSKKIDHEINPALNLLIDVLSRDYQAKAPEGVGLSQYSGGENFYQFLVRVHTTMNIKPEEIHQKGLKLVEDLNQKMAAIRESLHFKGSRAEFHQMLKTDPKFIPKTPEQIGDTLMKYVKRIEPRIDSYFMKKPKAAYGVQRLDPKLEGSMTFGYYRQPTPSDPIGIYYYNGSNLSERPLFNSASLIFHELIPGHHFQICLQAENDALPDFRKYSGHTAFIEGWAEYSSGLASDMGMYQDPYEVYGRLAAEMFLTVRLVVDTGMNQLGWSREKAMEFMRDNLLESETQIQTESLRYSCDIPGQALAYKMGSLKFVELREKAKAALGDQFDIRKFHDIVLSSGSMPMTVLEERVDRWIQQQK